MRRARRGGGPGWRALPALLVCLVLASSPATARGTAAEGEAAARVCAGANCTARPAVRGAAALGKGAARLALEGAAAVPRGEAGPIPLQNGYVERVADALLAGLVSPDMDAVGRVRAAYRYLATHVCFGQPVGLDIWRYQEGPSQAPDFTENRAISPLVFGVGSCEDFAAAMAVLCRRLGYPAQYVPGLTISVDGAFVDHAWTVVRLGDSWYHLDAQLENNVIKEGLLTYRYFLKDDAAMLADHRWGENLLRYYGNPGTGAARLIRERWTPPPCAGPPVPSVSERVQLPPRPGRAALQAAVDARKAPYLQRYGPPPPLDLPVEPPVTDLR